MARQIKDVFQDCLEGCTELSDVVIDELKFSKEKQIVILDAKTNISVGPVALHNFVQKVKIRFKLNQFIFNYKYVGEKINITPKNVKEALLKYAKDNVYAAPIFKEVYIKIEGNKIKINLQDTCSSILNIKKANKEIESLLNKSYNINMPVMFVDPEGVKNTCPVNFVKIVEDKEGNSIIPEIKKETPKKTEKKIKEPEIRQISIEENQEMRDSMIYGKYFEGNEINIKSIINPVGEIIIKGVICEYEDKVLKTKKDREIGLITFDITDYTSTIKCKMFAKPEELPNLKGSLKPNNSVKLFGKIEEDAYCNNELVMMVRSIKKIDFKKEERMDDAEEKRVELHMHTQMSALDAVSSVQDIVKQAIKWGHKAVAITDHGVVQAFPDAHSTAVTFGKGPEKEYKIKVIYGMEGYIVDDINDMHIDDPVYCILDIETTGTKKELHRVTEIGAVKVKNGEIIDEFSTFVNPEVLIPENIQELTGITNEMVKDAPTFAEVFPEFLKFIEGTILVAHNAPFDIPFLKYQANKVNDELDFNNLVIDTLEVARSVYAEFPIYLDKRPFQLTKIAERLGIKVDVAHRALDDVKTTYKVFMKMCEEIEKAGYYIYNFSKEANQVMFLSSITKKEQRRLNKPYHIIMLAKNYTGLKNLYKLISFSNLTHFHGRPRIPKSMLKLHKEGLILGSACEQGELYKAILEQKPQEKLQSICDFYDYYEIQPIGNNEFMLRKDPNKDDPFPTIQTKEDLMAINKKIVELGEKNNKLVVATCDVHFLNPEDEIYRRIIQSVQGYGDAENQAPLYFRTTKEMLDEFKYLGNEKAKEVVIENTNKIADMIEQIQPVPDGTYPPSIENAERDIEEMSYKTARSIYGENLPEIVEARLKKELKSIIGNGYAVMYMIAHKLVKKSNEDGYLVGSRGSVGSSLVATMTGITEVNPLPPHYICPKCKYSYFPETNVTTGVDMEDMDCPNCNIKMNKNGMDIPFETFLGFKGDKVPDIDLNFSGDNQGRIHRYTGELFGEGKTFKAGTIGTLADKTAYGYVKKYYEEKEEYVSSCEINRLSKGCVGIKRTTGQHPGGVIVVPHDRDIYEFCPVQHPADDPNSDIITTHFDFHKIHDNLLKLDILGHDDPTVIRMLQDITGVDPKTIPLDEPKVMSLFSSPEALGVTKEQIFSETGTYAVPEFGTAFVRQMLLDTKPTTFGELVRISGLSHGTDVWLGNAQTLIQEGTTTLSESICCRDDIMIYLIKKGMEPLLSFKTMESVRKGKGLTEEMENAMKEANVPDWYINSCKKIKYMFPKAHAAAYVMMAYRIAYYKVYYPVAFYSVYLTARAAVFDSEICFGGKDAVKAAMNRIKLDPEATPRDKDLYTVLEVVNECLERGVEFLPVDIYKSDASKFIIEDGKIRPPLESLNDFGGVVAAQLVEARKDGPFDSQEELQSRAKLGKVAMEVLEKNGCLKGMPKSPQMNFFEL